MRLTIEIKRGKELLDSYINLMNRQRIKEYGENTKNFKKDELNSIFFFLKDGKGIVSFGMLKPITIIYLGKKYNILGIGNIISIKKRKGYGRILINSMINYLKKKGKTGLGFTKKTKIFEKMGLKSKKNLTLRFRYRYATAEEEKRELEEGGDGIYYNGKDNFIKKVLSTKSLVYIDVPFW